MGPMLYGSVRLAKLIPYARLTLTDSAVNRTPRTWLISFVGDTGPTILPVISRFTNPYMPRGMLSRDIKHTQIHQVQLPDCPWTIPFVLRAILTLHFFIQGPRLIQFSLFIQLPFYPRLSLIFMVVDGLVKFLKYP